MKSLVKGALGLRQFLQGMPPPPAWGRGLKISEVFAGGGSEIFILVGGYIVRGMKFFLIHPGHWNIFLEGFKVFCVVLMKDKSSHIKNRKAWW